MSAARTKDYVPYDVRDRNGQIGEAIVNPILIVEVLSAATAAGAGETVQIHGRDVAVDAIYG